MSEPMPADAQDAIYDESQVPQYTLPDPLIAEDGTEIATAQQWEQIRRPELLRLFEQHVFGLMPEADGKHAVEVQAEAADSQTVSFAIDPDQPQQQVKGLVREVRLTIRAAGKPSAQTNESKNGQSESPGPVAVDGDLPTIKLRLLSIVPAATLRPVPVFLGYNFVGNHTIDATDVISLNEVWSRPAKEFQTPTEQSRGSNASRWPVGLILSNGFGLVTLHYGDVDPDFDDDFKNGAHSLFPDLQHRPDNWTSIGAWAWGLHRVLDYLETDYAIDSNRVIVFGHSRLGKTALWTGASDLRVAAVISNNSGCGGAALSRRRFGESVRRINTVFPHWFCLRHRDYNDNEAELPVDHHQLIALMAPRPVYVASAEEDRWADPHGEYLSAFHASPVYELFEETGLGQVSPEMPKPNLPIGDSVRYHIRSGKHDVTRYDWVQYLKFATDHFSK